MGNITDGTSTAGGALSVETGGNSDAWSLRGSGTANNGGKVRLYGSHVYASDRIDCGNNSEFTAIDCDCEFEDSVSPGEGGSSNAVINYTRSRIHHTGAVGVKAFATNGNTTTLTNARIEKCLYAIQPMGTQTFENLSIDSCNNHLVPNLDAATVTFINPDFTSLRVFSGNAADITNIEFRYGLTVTNAAGTALSGVSVRLTDQQGSHRFDTITNASGNPTTFPSGTFQNSTWAGTSGTTRSAHILRARAPAFQWGDYQRNATANLLADRVPMIGNTLFTQSEATAQAHTGITITDHAGSPVSWNSLSWGITVTGDKTTNPTLNASDIYHYITFHCSKTATIAGRSGLDWHQFFTGKTDTQRSEATYYAGVRKGVRVVDENGNPFPGFTSFQSDNGTIYNVPTSDDLTVTSTQAGTLLQVFATGTQTIIASTTGASLVYTHAGQTVDIVAQKAGFLPQRVTGIVLTGNVSQAFTLATDYNYNASHGLTYTTSASWSRANNQLTVPSWGPSVRNVYSLMIDSFISETSLRNTPFNLSMNGSTSLFLINGAEGASDASITNMTGGGVRYRSVAGVTTAEYVGVLSQGVVAGSQPEYELGAGGAVVDTRATGDVNEIIKTYGDSTHGNFDKRGHLQFKVQRNGYRQAESDVLDSYGIAAVEPTLYVISLNMLAIDGFTLGNPSATGLTITDNSSSPVSWDAGDGAKNYSITITDSGANSGATVLRWLNWNLSLDATFQGKEPFYWPEMVLDNGAAFETLRGVLHSNPDSIVGVRVIRTGGTPHPDFTRFQSDDGSYATPPVVSSGTITGILAGSKVRIYNETELTETYIGTPGTSYSTTYQDGTGYTTGDTVNVRIHKRGYLTYEASVVVSSSGWAVTVNQVADDVYDSLAIDGSTVTGFAADYANDEVNVTIASDFSVSDLYAWWSFNLESDDGIRQFVGGLTAMDQANYRINAATVDIYLDNTTATNIKQIDNRRIYRSDGAYPVKSSGGGGMDVVWRNQILIAETGVSGLTPSESAQLQKLDTLTEIAGSPSGLRFTAKALETAGGTAAPTVSQIWSHATRTLTNNPGLDATAVQAAATAALTAYDPPTQAEMNAALAALPTPPTASAIRIEMDSNSTKLANLDTTVGSRMATFTYTAPDNASITAIKAKTDLLPSDPADNSVLVDAITSVPANVRTNLATELGRIDAAITTRLPLSAYVAPDNTNLSAIKAKTDLLPSDPADNSDILGAIANVPANVRTNLATELARINTTISSRMAMFTYTAPDNASITAIKAKTDLLPTDPADNSTIIDAISAVPTNVRNNIATELQRIDANVSSRMATFSYTAPDNASLSAVKLKTDNLPSDPASASAVKADMQTINTGVKKASRLIPHSADV
jgi:hypothetical protein